MYFLQVCHEVTRHSNTVVKQTLCTFETRNIQTSSLETNLKPKRSVAPPRHHDTDRGQQVWEETRKRKLDSLTSKPLHFRDPALTLLGITSCQD